MRVRQLLALEEAGLVRFTGPGMRVDVDDEAGRFVVTAGEDCRYSCDGVLEAHLPGVELNAFTSPLLRAWRERGEARPVRLPAQRAEGQEDGQKGQDRDERGQRQAAGERCEVWGVHGSLRHAAAAVLHCTSRETIGTLRNGPPVGPNP